MRSTSMGAGSLPPRSFSHQLSPSSRTPTTSAAMDDSSADLLVSEAPRASSRHWDARSSPSVARASAISVA
ncbi:hypothetical protein, partial [Nonomuraea dietziae]|uniref:hypothetical protein n=1 Tax=Nonomuraea dietziae TaxID=65515 RepID=UPI0031D64611